MVAAMDATPSNRSQSLGEVASRGTIWSVAEVLASKVLSLGAQWMLAWKLTEAEIGVANTAAMAASLCFLANAGALADLLTARSRGFRRWIRAGTMLSTRAGFVSFVAVVAIGPLLAMLYAPAGRSIAWFTALVAVAAARAFADTLACVPQTQMRVAFRFRLYSTVQFLSSLTLAIASLALAFGGAGPFAVVGGLGAAAVVRAGLLWWLGGVSPRRAPRSPPARSLLRGLGWLIGSQYLNTVGFTAGVLVLGIFRDEREVGLYALAFNLSYQVNVLLSTSLGQVLQPVFGAIHGQHQRQVGAFLRAMRAILVLAIPLCLLQGALAEPLLRLAFQPRWLDAAMPLMILSVAQAFAMSQGPAMALIKAQRRFRTVFLWQAAQTLAYIIALVVLCPWLGAEGAALAMLVQFVVFGPVGVRLAMAQAPGSGWLDALRPLALPLLLGAPVAIGAWWLVGLFPTTRMGSLGAIAAAGSAGLMAGAILLRIAAPALFSTLLSAALRRRGA